MYRTRIVHPFARDARRDTDGHGEALWSLFVAIGEFWGLDDDPDRYRLRLISFMENRIDLNPLYRETYRRGAELIDELIAETGAAATFQKILGAKPRISPAGVPDTQLETLQRFVVNEFITLRLALGGFKAFGAINYPGYPAGANIKGQPVPYRSKDDG